jgi:hypothetical protein
MSYEDDGQRERFVRDQFDEIVDMVIEIERG